MEVTQIFLDFNRNQFKDIQTFIFHVTDMIALTISLLPKCGVGLQKNHLPK